MVRGVMQAALQRLARRHSAHAQRAVLAARCTRMAAGMTAQRGVLTRQLSISHVNGAGDADDNEDDSELSPLERLLQHSQQYRKEAGLDELSEDDKESLVDDESEEPEEKAQGEEESEEPAENAEDGEEPVDDWEEADDLREHQAEGHHDHDGHHDERRFAASRDDDGEQADDSWDFESPRGPRRPHHHQRRRNSRPVLGDVARRMRRQILYADEIDYEHGLSHLDERRAQEKMYLQLLRRDYDRDRVCQNCGEPGHVARNCMLPTICSNCGDIGHRRHECPHNDYASRRTAIDAAHVSDKEERAAILRTELQALHARHDRMKQAFDDEIEEYLSKYEHTRQSRRKAAPSAASDEEHR
ncbi:hypothetical protein P43SY_008350 [Pythium insidiosum]|uniref:CCHC-type domain-containing protein n=1 Tax=Pythium insidiosum TaxID=114742 RepID=A0AAD5Q8V7_PYTIN|nr:hypothetical protein P43SY_008350 [Pythium insidiosum]